MNRLSQIILAALGFAVGVIASFLLAALYVHATYSCQPGPIEPCDAGPYVGIGIGMLLSPILGCVFAFLGYRLAVGRKRP